MSNLATNSVSLRINTWVLLIWKQRREWRAKERRRIKEVKKVARKEGWDEGCWGGERKNMEMKERKGSASFSPLLDRHLVWVWQSRRVAGRKVEKTVSITPGTHRRIICWGWVNCDLRSVMTCNNFLSLLSGSRQVRSPQRGRTVDIEKNRKLDAVQTNERGHIV